VQFSSVHSRLVASQVSNAEARLVGVLHSAMDAIMMVDEPPNIVL